jgi:hypothetical protein
LNLSCFNLWKQLSNRDRPPGQGDLRPVPTKAIADICEVYGLTIQAFERIGLIEGQLFEWLAEKHREQLTEGTEENGGNTDSGRYERWRKKS